MILDAICSPSNIRFTQDFSLLNEAREKLDGMIDKLHSMVEEPRRPHIYRKVLRKAYLAMAKSKKRPAKKMRSLVRVMLCAVKRNMAFVDAYLAKGLVLADKRDIWNLDAIRKLYTQGKESGAFLVFMPDSSRHNLRTHNFSEAENFISNAITTIQSQNKDREISIPKDSKKPIAKRNYCLATTHQNQIEKFSEIVKHISKNQSMVLTWDEIIDSMYDTEDKTLGIKSDTEKLRTFYEKALDEIRKQTTTSMRNA